MKPTEVEAGQLSRNVKKKRKRIAICVHAFNTVDFDVYFNHMWCVAHWALEHDLVFIGKGGLAAALAREAIIARCFEQKCDYAFIMDADHYFPVESLNLLLETGNEAMVSGLVCKKGDNFEQVGWLKDDEKNLYMPVDLPLDGKTYEVGVCAFGCTLINLRKLEKLKKPYFRDTYNEKTKINIRSDINLCNAFRDIGEKVWIDTRVLIGHAGMISTIYPQNAKHFERLKELEADLPKLRQGQQGVYYVPQ